MIPQQKELRTGSNMTDHTTGSLGYRSASQTRIETQMRIGTTTVRELFDASPSLMLPYVAKPHLRRAESNVSAWKGW
jgi:hypothetical protein